MPSPREGANALFRHLAGVPLIAPRDGQAECGRHVRGPGTREGRLRAFAPVRHERQTDDQLRGPLFVGQAPQRDGVMVGVLATDRCEWAHVSGRNITERHADPSLADIHAEQFHAARRAMGARLRMERRV